jgi:hypothetical protein
MRTHDSANLTLIVMHRKTALRNSEEWSAMVSVDRLNDGEVCRKREGWS